MSKIDSLMLKFIPIFLARLESLSYTHAEKAAIKAQILDLFKTHEELEELIIDLSDILNQNKELRPLTATL